MNTKSNKTLYIIIIFLFALLCFILFPGARIFSFSTKNSFLDFLYAIFLLYAYYKGITLIYTRFECRGKYANPLLHFLFIAVGLPFFSLVILYLFIGEPYIRYLENKKGKKITSLIQLGINIGQIPKLNNLSPISSIDSSFNEERFISKVKNLFLHVYNSRTNDELTNFNFLMSDGLQEQFDY